MAQNGELETCIVGAGMSGLVMGIRLMKAGKRFHIYEKANTVGGTWRENSAVSSRRWAGSVS